MKELSMTEYDGANKDRRQAIKYLYLAVFAAPPQTRWHKMKFIPAISYMLKISKNSHSKVKETLLQISQEKDHTVAPMQLELDGRRLSMKGLRKPKSSVGHLNAAYCIY
jgi:hypothetical protein